MKRPGSEILQNACAAFKRMTGLSLKIAGVPDVGSLTLEAHGKRKYYPGRACETAYQRIQGEQC